LRLHELPTPGLLLLCCFAALLLPHRKCKSSCAQFRKYFEPDVCTDRAGGRRDNLKIKASAQSGMQFKWHMCISAGRLKDRCRADLNEIDGTLHLFLVATFYSCE
jgi:hypothetical protein